MHEMGIALEIHRICRDAMGGRGDGRIERVRIAVGELSAVEPDLLRFAWEAVVADGADAGSILEVDWRAAQQYCPACACNVERSTGTWLRLCGDCGGALQVTGGDELDVLQLVFLEDGAANGEADR